MGNRLATILTKENQNTYQASVQEETPQRPLKLLTPTVAHFHDRQYAEKMAAFAYINKKLLLAKRQQQQQQQIDDDDRHSISRHLSTPKSCPSYVDIASLVNHQYQPQQQHLEMGNPQHPSPLPREYITAGNISSPILFTSCTRSTSGSANTQDFIINNTTNNNNNQQQTPHIINPKYNNNNISVHNFKDDEPVHYASPRQHTTVHSKNHMLKSNNSNNNNNPEIIADEGKYHHNDEEDPEINHPINPLNRAKSPYIEYIDTYSQQNPINNLIVDDDDNHSSNSYSSSKNAKTSRMHHVDSTKYPNYSFYVEQTPGNGLFLKDIWNSSFSFKENNVEYFNWLFPTSKHTKKTNVRSQYPPLTPLTRDEAKLIARNDTARNNVIESLRVMLLFWGFELFINGHIECDPVSRNSSSSHLYQSMSNSNTQQPTCDEYDRNSYSQHSHHQSSSSLNNYGQVQQQHNNIPQNALFQQQPPQQQYVFDLYNPEHNPILITPHHDPDIQRHTFSNWLTPNNHNIDRITRVLTSLVYLHLEPYAIAFLIALFNITQPKDQDAQIPKRFCRATQKLLTSTFPNQWLPIFAELPNYKPICDDIHQVCMQQYANY